MRRHLLFIVTLFATTLALGIIQKPVFLLWYADLVAEASTAEWWSVLWHGALLDVTVAGYITALPLLLVIASVWLPHRVWRKIIGWYLAIVSTIEALIFTVNLGLYEYWAFPLDGAIFQFLTTPKEAMASITAWLFFKQSLVALAWGGVAWLFYHFVVKLFDPTRRMSLGRRATFTAIMLLVAGLDFLAIRGGVTTAVANISKVYFSDRMVLNHAAVNPAFSLLESLSNSDSLDDYNFVDEPTRDANFSTLCRSDNTSSTIEPLLCSQRPNIVLIIAESFGRSTIDHTVDGRAVAPRIQSLKSEGVWFENIISSSFRTDRGVVATLSGFPAQPTMSVMKDPVKSRNLPSIAASLRNTGYATHYIHGGDLNFTNMASYLYGTGFNRLVAFKDLKFNAPTSKWGYADDVVADYFIDFVREQNRSEQPHFTVWQTLSSHEPFDVPTTLFDDKMLNSMAFADEQIGRVVDALRDDEEWANTLVIIIADHAYPFPYGIAAGDALRYRIPMLWLGGALCRTATVETFASQSDLAATLLAQMGLPYDEFRLSRNIFADGPHFGYYTYNNGFGVVDADGATTFDCTLGRTTTTYTDPEAELTGKTMLQTTYKIIKEL